MRRPGREGWTGTLQDQLTPPASLGVRVYYEDTDAGGVAYHTSYLRWFERGRTEWLRSLGLGQAELAERTGHVFAVRSLSADYRAPARLDDRLEVLTRVHRPGRARLGFDQVARRGGTLLCRAGVEVVCLDAAGRPRPLPHEIFERLDDDG